MTVTEKSEVRQQFHKVADIQADSIIKAIETIDSHLPKDTPAEQRKSIIEQIVTQAVESISVSTTQLADKMMEIKPEVNNG